MNVKIEQMAAEFGRSAGREPQYRQIAMRRQRRERGNLGCMNVASQVITASVAALHGYFLVLEMFLWGTPFGARTFARPLEEMQRTKTLAANQGLYNGFLAAGLVWSLITGAVQVRIFFLACVVIAGIYGAVTASKKILVLQALPAAAGLIVTLGLP